MSGSLVSPTERAELYRELAVWLAPSVPEIRRSLEALGQSEYLEDILQPTIAAVVTGMEQSLVNAGLESEARVRGFLPTWDRWSASRTTPGRRWFPSTTLTFNTRPTNRAGLEAAVPLIKSALDYLLAGMRANAEAVLSNRPDVEVLDGGGNVVSRTRRVRT